MAVKRIVVAPFFELAGEGISPDFDRFRPSDLVILILFAEEGRQLTRSGKSSA